jgi:hypothetical protein
MYAAIKKFLLGDHGADIAGIKQVDEKGFQEIVLMVPEAYFVEALLLGYRKKAIPA